MNWKLAIPILGFLIVWWIGPTYPQPVVPASRYMSEEQITWCSHLLVKKTSPDPVQAEVDAARETVRAAYKKGLRRCLAIIEDGAGWTNLPDLEDEIRKEVNQN